MDLPLQVRITSSIKLTGGTQPKKTKQPTVLPDWSTQRRIWLPTAEELMNELLDKKRELVENVIVPFNISESQKKIVEKLGVQSEVNK